MTPGISRREAAELADLIFHWGGHGGYDIRVTSGQWTATPHGHYDGTLAATSERMLRKMIRADHFARSQRPSVLAPRH